MTNIRNLFAVSATVAALVATHNVFAQDDLDNLLKDLENEAVAKKPAAKEQAAAPVATEAAAEEKPAEAEKPAAEEKPVEEKKVEESVATVNELAAEVKEEKKPLEQKKVAPAAPANPDAELIANLRATETLRRVALDTQAKREIDDARECMENEEYSEAVRHYGLAAKLLNDRPGSVKLRKECDQGIAEGLYRAALQEKDLGRNERAQKLMEKALDMRHPRARKTLETGSPLPAKKFRPAIFPI